MSSPLKDLELSSEELKEEIATLLAKKRNIKGYKSMSEDEVLGAIILSKPVRKGEKNLIDTNSKTNVFKARIEKIRKEFNESRYRFSKLRINEIRRNIYEIENEKNLFASKIKEIESIMIMMILNIKE